MVKKKQTQLPFRGRDAVALTAIWIGVYLLVTYALSGTLTSSNLLSMFVGLTFAFVFSILFRNGW